MKEKQNATKQWTWHEVDFVSKDNEVVLILNQEVLTYKPQ
jgi:hypothetical protein